MSDTRGHRELGRYRKVHLKVWRDKTFRSLSPIKPSAQSLWLHLLTGPVTTAVPGVIPAGLVELNQGLDWEQRDLAFHLDEILAAGMAKADLAAPLLWLPKAILLNPPQSPNVIKSWKWVLAELPESLLREPACMALWTAVQEMGPGWSKAFRNVCPRYLDLSKKQKNLPRSGDTCNADASSLGPRLPMHMHQGLAHPGAGAGTETGAGDRPSATIEANRGGPVAGSGLSLSSDFELPEAEGMDLSIPVGQPPDGVKQDRSSMESAQLFMLHLQCSLKDQGVSQELQAASYQLKPLGCFSDSGDPVLEAPTKARTLLKSICKGAVIFKESKT